MYVVVTADIAWRNGQKNGEMHTYYCEHTHGNHAEIRWEDSNYFVEANDTGFVLFKRQNQTKVVLNATMFDGLTLLCQVNGNGEDAQESAKLYISKHQNRIPCSIVHLRIIVQISLHKCML